MDRAKALDGVIVAELATRAGGAFCGSLLAQLGATVIAVEAPGAAAEKALWREQFAAGKLSFAPADNAADRALLESLAAVSDVVITSSDADPPLLRLPKADSPANVVCDITAFGSAAPIPAEKYGELQIQALSGIMDTTGFPGDAPVPIAVPIASVLTGAYSAAAILAARRAARLYGFGQAIDMALFDCAFLALGSFLSGTLTSSVTKSRLGNRHPTVAPWNLYRSRDGWVLICAGSQVQWERLCLLLKRPDLAATYSTQPLRIAHTREIDAAIEAWTQRFTTAECVDQLVAASIAGGPIAPIDDRPREANLDYRQMIRRLLDPVSGRELDVPGSPLRMSLTPGAAPQAIPAPDQHRATVGEIVARRAAPAKPHAAPQPGMASLAGLRVIEIGQYTTAPLCARQLAHLGAEVIKVEPPGGDHSRTWVPQVNGSSVSFKLHNTDKKSMVVDLRTEAGVALLRRLIGSADVLVENLKPGTLAKFGFTAERVLAANPRIVYCAISGFGADSLYASRPAFDMVIQAMSGFMSALSSGPVPLKSGISTADTMGAEIAMVAILAALEHRDRSGAGQYIDLSMQDIAAWLTMTSWNGAGARAPKPLVLACADGYLLAAAHGEAAPDLDAGLRDRLASLKREDAEKRLARSGITATPVLNVRESAHLPNTMARGLWFTRQENGFGWPVLFSPIRLQATPPAITRAAPAVDEHGEAILRELGMRRDGGEDAHAPARRDDPLLAREPLPQ